jgi:hypothetical protein
LAVEQFYPANDPEPQLRELQSAPGWLESRDRDSFVNGLNDSWAIKKDFI